MSTNTHVLELLPGYVLDILEQDELILVSEHLVVCPECRAELRAYETVVDRLALAVPDAAPPARLQRKLMTRIRPQGPQVSRSSRFTNLMQRSAPIWGLVSLFLIIILGISNLLLWQQLNHLESARLSGQLGTIALAGTEIAPYANGLIIVSMDGKHGTLVVDGLPSLGEDWQYQLWLIDDGRRESGAVFSVGQYGYGSVWVSSPEPLSGYSTFGISIEPAGGSPKPTGDRVMGGTIN